MSDSDVRAFHFANAKKKAGGLGTVGSFQINGEEFKVRALRDTSVAYLIHKARSGDASVVISAVLDFLEKALDPEDYPAFEALALDPDDGLELDQVVEVFEHVLSMVAAGPSTSASDSSGRRSQNGAGSRTTSRAKASSTR